MPVISLLQIDKRNQLALPSTTSPREEVEKRSELMRPHGFSGAGHKIVRGRRSGRRYTCHIFTTVESFVDYFTFLLPYLLLAVHPSCSSQCIWTDHGELLLVASASRPSQPNNGRAAHTVVCLRRRSRVPPSSRLYSGRKCRPHKREDQRQIR